jgi:hypothetical protein
VAEEAGEVFLLVEWIIHLATPLAGVVAVEVPSEVEEALVAASEEAGEDFFPELDWIYTAINYKLFF